MTSIENIFDLEKRKLDKNGIPDVNTCMQMLEEFQEDLEFNVNKNAAKLNKIETNQAKVNKDVKDELEHLHNGQIGLQNYSRNQNLLITNLPGYTIHS